MLRLRSAAAAAAALALLAPAASAEWSGPFDVSDPGDVRREPRVVVDPAGVSVAAWLADGRVQARRIAADGTLGPILDVSPAGRTASAPELGVDASGDVTVAWSDRDPLVGTEEIVRVRGIDASGALGPTVDLTPPGLTSRQPRVAIHPSGDVTVAWFRSPGTVHLRQIRVTGGLGPTFDIAPPDSGSHDVAVADSGEVYVVFATFDGSDQLIVGRRLDATGGLEAPVALSDDTQLSFSPRVAVAGGAPVFAWTREDHSIELLRGLVAAQPEEMAPAGAAPVVSDLTVAPSGEATVAWRGTSGTSQAVFLRRLSAAGVLGPVNDLWSGGHDGDPQLALDAAGGATLIWENSDTGGNLIRTRTAGSPFGPIVDLLPARTADVAADPELAIGAGGEMTAVWRRENVDEGAIVAARFTVPQPPVQPEPDPADPGPPSDPGAPACVPVTITRAAALAGTRRNGAKGVGVRLTLDAEGRLRIVSAKVSYRHDGRRRWASLATLETTRTAIRLRLPRRHARRLELGRRVRLELRARAGADGCPYGAAASFSLRTRVIRVPR